MKTKFYENIVDKLNIYKLYKNISINKDFLIFATHIISYYRPHDIYNTQ